MAAATARVCTGLSSIPFFRVLDQGGGNSGLFRASVKGRDGCDGTGCPDFGAGCDGFADHFGRKIVHLYYTRKCATLDEPLLRGIKTRGPQSPE